MRIGLDYIATIGNGLSGNSAYSQNLIKELLERNTDNEYYLFLYWHDYLLGRNCVDIPHVRRVPAYFSSLGLPLPQSWNIFISATWVRFWSRVLRLDIVHFTNPLNYVPGVPHTVLTIHDLSTFHNKEWANKATVDYFETHMKQMLEEAEQIIAVSESTKRDIESFFPEEGRKVSVVYEGAGEDYYPDKDPNFIKSEFNLENYFLYVGQIQPRKNVLSLIRAYANLPEDIQKEYKLALVGGMREGQYKEEVLGAIKNLNLTERVRHLGYQPNDTVRKLYNGAKAFVFPSYSEGFGIPVLEALQCGAPVITSNTSSLPEVAGKAGILIDPHSVAEISKAMEEVVRDEVLESRLRTEALSEAKRFSWQKAAREVQILYEAAGRKNKDS